jgi:hypothetical protein
VISRAFRVLMALLIAVPLGVGGLCCCLLGASGAQDSAAATTPSCCAGESGPVAPPACPEHEDDCSCPSRDAALLAKSAPTEGAAPAAPATLAPAAVHTPVDVPALKVAGLSGPPTPYPPPKVAVYRTLCAILC